MKAETTSPVPVGAWADLLHPIFPRCVGPREGRYDLSRPFVIGEYAYATDARIAVRMPAPDRWAAPNPEKAPHPRTMLDLFGEPDGYPARWRADPTQFPPVGGACAVCRGRKVLPEMDCPWCEAESPNPYEAGLCEECYELEGRIPAGPCYECEGTGLFEAHGRVEVAPGYWLQRKYVALLHEFEMTTYLPARLDPHQVTRFTQGDVTGVLMPMTPPDARGSGRSRP